MTTVLTLETEMRCGECPFYYVDAGAYCTVGADGRERRITAEEMLDGEHDVPPDWCPRRKGAVVVPMWSAPADPTADPEAP